jgi:hypothetical protein
VLTVLLAAVGFIGLPELTLIVLVALGAAAVTYRRRLTEG